MQITDKQNLLLFLWVSQIFLIFWGSDFFGKFLTPFFILFNNLSFIILYFKVIKLPKKIVASYPSKIDQRVIFSLFIILVLFTIFNFKKAFQHFQHPVEYSDIIPQLDSQSHRFKEGVTVYKPILLSSSKPFPVYMPFHWLPILFTDFFGLDSRWSGVFFLMISFAVYIFYVYKMKLKLYLQFIFLLLPFISVFAFFFKAVQELSVSLETIVASYYFILAIGLMQRNLLLTIVGITLCLLSRYTLIFWLPFFVLALLLNRKYKQMFWVIVVPLVALFIFYIKPFVLIHPDIFITGLKYHNDAAAFEWEHSAWTFENGLYFAPHFNELIKGNYEHKIFITRVFQALVLLVVTFYGVFFYSKNKNKFNTYDFSLGMLYSLLICFFLFGPLTYKYYLLTTILFATILILKAFTFESE